MQPTIAQMRMALNQRPSTYDIQQIGVNEAPDVNPKPYLPPSSNWEDNDGVPPGGLPTQSGMPVGGVDMSVDQPGQQMMTAQAGPQPQATAPQLQGQSNPLNQPPSNILQMTPQGQALSALKPPTGPTALGMAKGGMVKISKTAPRAWAGTGFGSKGASYGIDTHPHIYVKRESHGWTAINATFCHAAWLGEVF